MLNDIRYALRTLVQNPGFALTAILSIGIAIGANSAIFSGADGLLLRPLPVGDPRQVVTLRGLPPSASALPVPGTGPLRLSYSDFQDFRRALRSFEGLAAADEMILAFARGTTKAASQFKLAAQVSGDFFRVFRIEPQVGRGFRPDEDEIPGKDAVAVLSYGCWQNEFAKDPAVIGSHIRLNNATFTVIGVAPESFTGLDPFLQPEIYLPIAIGSTLSVERENELTDRTHRWFIVKGRLKPGVSVRAAADEAAAFAKSLEQSYPETNREFGATVVTERQMRLAAQPVIGRFVGDLFTVSLVVLLIACANVANLMLGRGRVRAREIAVRLTVGASRGRLLRLLLIESAVIALASAPIALLSAEATLGIFSRLEVPSDLPIHLTVRLDERAIWFTVALSGLTALFFGLVPAIQSTRPNLISIMKTGEAERRRRRFLGFRPSDREDGPLVAVVNEEFARQYLPGNPIGQRLRLKDRNSPPIEVVGLTVTGKTFLLIEPPERVIYLPLNQNPHATMTLIAETAGDPAALAGPLQAMVRSIDPNLAIFRVRTMEDIFAHGTVNTLSTAGKTYTFAAVVGLVLALVGLYAVVSYQVSRRTREIGIRMALGAKRTQVLRIFLLQALTMSASGLLIGVVFSVFANRISESTLGAVALNPILVIVVSAALLLTAIAAATIPAHRASRIDPQQALRQD